MLIKTDNQNGNLYLIGQGGIGKTTALMHIMNHAYENAEYTENAQIPIFVELSYAPDSAFGNIYEDGKSTFIRRSIFRQVRADREIRQIGTETIDDLKDLFQLPYELAVKPVTDLLNENKPAPEYLLLLDGLNEVSTGEIELETSDGTGKIKTSVYRMIWREIRWLAEHCPNVRIVLTSRSDESGLQNNIIRLYLSELDDSTVTTYLLNAGVDSVQVDRIRYDRILRETLHVPLFLTMYASLENKAEATAAGEILKMFFHERRRNIGDYTITTRIRETDNNIVDSSAGDLIGRITPDMYDFILDFILPEIAWHMERDNEFYLNKIKIKKLIEPVLLDTDDLSICGDYGQLAFADDKINDATVHTKSVARKMLQWSLDFSDVNEIIINLCVNVLGVLQKTGAKYGFIHQHIRDYFAAVKNINTMRLSVYMFEEGEKELALECMNRVFKDEPVSLSVRRFIGEYLGEHKNKPYFSDGKWLYAVPIDKSDRNLLDRVLDLFRGRFEMQEIDGYALFSLVQILKEIREDLSGICFSNLDLTRLNLNGVAFSRRGLIANFDYAKINRDNLIQVGHNKEITSVSFSPKGDTILTSSKDGVAIIWNIETCSEIATLYGHKGEIRCASFSPDGKLILTKSFDLSYNQCVKIWDATRYLEIGTYSPDSGQVSTVCFSPDGSKILITSFEENVIIWDIKSSRIDGKLKGKNQTITRAEYVLNGNLILTISNEGILTLWDANTYVQIKQRNLSIEDKPNVKIANSILAISYGEEIELWDCLLQEKKGLINGNLRNACFSTDGQKIAIASSDDYSVEIWDISSCNKMITLSGHSSTITSLSFNTCGNLLLTTSWDGTAKIWEIKSGREIEAFSDRNKDWVTLGCFSPDGKKIITVSDGEGATKLWDLVTFNEIGSFRQSFHHSQFGCYAQNCNRYAISLSDSNSEAIVCDSINNQVENVLIGHKNRINSICFCSDNKKVATASDDGTVKIWDVKSGLELGSLVGHKDDVIDISFNLNGDKLISSSRDGTAKIWDMGTMREIQSFAENDSYFDNQILSARFSPDDKMVVTISFNHKAKIWDTESGAMLCTLNMEQTGGLDLTPCASFDPYGKMILTTCGNIAYMWDARTKRLLKRFPHSSDIQWACFSPDGGKILTISYKSVFIWSIQIESPIAIITCEDDDSFFIHADYCPDGRKIMTTQYNDIVKIWSTSTYECLHSNKLVSGLIIVGCDFRNLYPGSQFTQKDKEILRYYGSFID